MRSILPLFYLSVPVTGLCHAQCPLLAAQYITCFGAGGCQQGVTIWLCSGPLNYYQCNSNAATVTCCGHPISTGGETDIGCGYPTKVRWGGSKDLARLDPGAGCPVPSAAPSAPPVGDRKARESTSPNETRELSARLPNLSAFSCQLAHTSRRASRTGCWPRTTCRRVLSRVNGSARMNSYATGQAGVRRT